MDLTKLEIGILVGLGICILLVLYTFNSVPQNIPLIPKYAMATTGSNVKTVVDNGSYKIKGGNTAYYISATVTPIAANQNTIFTCVPDSSFNWTSSKPYTVNIMGTSNVFTSTISATSSTLTINFLSNNVDPHLVTLILYT